MCCLYGHGHHTEQMTFMAMASSIIRWLMPLSINTIYSPLLQQIIVMKLLSFKHIFILGALLAAGSVQVHAADEVTGKVRSWN